MNSSTSPNSGSHTARLTLEEVAALLRTSNVDVQERTKRGELIAFKTGSSAQETLYPAFQFLPELRELVHAVLGLLRPLDAYAFLAAVHPEMKGLSPLEMLLGLPSDSRPLPMESQQLLAMSRAERNTFVLDWCHTYSRQLESQ